MTATFLDFYTIDLTAIVIILLVTSCSFMLINYNENKKDENYAFNLGLSACIGIFGSIVYSYVTLESDEIMTSNYWE
jgi:anaerobic C4-dicarboxylate transporter